MKQLEKTLKALANARRLRMVGHLKKAKVASVATIAKEAKTAYKTTSKHLAILYQSEIVDREQVGFEMHYRLAAQLHPAVRHVLTLLD